MKVLFINDYPMDRIWKLWKQGVSPGNHLWGITHLGQYGIDVDILPHEKFSILKRGLSKPIGSQLGNMDQQLRILLRRSPYDIIYSASQNNTYLLALLRAQGIFSKPIIATMHSPPRNVFKNQPFINGHDKLLCLSQVIRTQIEERFKVPEGKLEVLHWGVDLSFYEKTGHVKNKSEFILAAGITSRDYDTLIKAFQKINYPLLISPCTNRQTVAPSFGELPSHIRVRESFVPHTNLLSDYQKAYAIAIPLKIPQDHRPSLIGLTSLLEAMAMGKAVVMTRNRQIDLDIEKEGVGIWIEAGDVEGWQSAISYLLAHPGETMEMGRRGYLLCKKQYNLEIFSAKLASVLKTVA